LPVPFISFVLIAISAANVENADFKNVELGSVTVHFSNFSKALNADIPANKENVR